MTVLRVQLVLLVCPTRRRLYRRSIIRKSLMVRGRRLRPKSADGAPHLPSINGSARSRADNKSCTTAGYLAANPTFPHQTTANQFFNPDQFDAYRLLGYESGVRMIEDMQLTTTIAQPATILSAYNRAARPEYHIT